MLEALIMHIEQFISVSGDLKQRLEKICTGVAKEKGDFLNKPDQVHEYTYFVVSGLLRVFYKKDEKEVTDNFCAENEWVPSINCFMKNIPDNCYIETLEESKLIAINILDLEKCFEDFPELERFGRLLISNCFIQQSERIRSIQFHSAMERYRFFFNTSKDKLQRVPLGMLASHLGMTQETLSRVRADKDLF